MRTPIYTAWLDYSSEPVAREGQTVKIHLQFRNAIPNPQWLELNWHLPEGWLIAPDAKTTLVLPQYTSGLLGNAEVDFSIIPGVLTQPRYDLFLDVKSNGRHTRCVIPVTLLTAANGVSN